MESYIFYIIILLITGMGIGFTSGLLGVGGGFIMVPIQFWVLTSLGVDPTIAIRVSLGTSLAVILPTAISGAIGHYRKKAVLLKPMIFLGLTGALGGILGGTIATHIPGDIIKTIFGVAAIVVALKMLTVKYSEIDKKPVDNTFYYIIWGFFAGIMSGLLGVGGGFILVPIMVILMHFSIHRAIGTSAAVIMFTSIGGIISYIFNGLNISGLPHYSLGYINLLQLIILAGASIPMAQLGVKAAHKLPAQKLSYIFIALMIYIGLKMIGL